MNSNDIIRIFDTDKISIESILKRSSKILGFNDNDYKLIVKEFTRMKLGKLFSVDIPIKGVKITKLNYGIIKIKISTVLGKNNKNSIDIVISRYIETSKVFISIVNFVWFDEINFSITLDYTGLVKSVNINILVSDIFTMYNPGMGRYDKKSSYILSISDNKQSPKIECEIIDLDISYMDNFSEEYYSHYLKNIFGTSPILSFAFNTKISERWGKDSVVKIPLLSIESILDVINMPIDTNFFTLSANKYSIIKRDLDFDDNDMHLIKNMDEIFPNLNLEKFIENILDLNIVKSKNEVVEYLKIITTTNRLLEDSFRSIFSSIDFTRYETKKEYVVEIDSNKKFNNNLKDCNTLNIVSNPVNPNNPKESGKEIDSGEPTVK